MEDILIVLGGAFVAVLGAVFYQRKTIKSNQASFEDLKFKEELNALGKDSVTYETILAEEAKKRQETRDKIKESIVSDEQLLNIINDYLKPPK